MSENSGNNPVFYEDINATPIQRLQIVSTKDPIVDVPVYNPSVPVEPPAAAPIPPAAPTAPAPAAAAPARAAKKVRFQSKPSVYNVYKENVYKKIASSYGRQLCFFAIAMAILWYLPSALRGMSPTVAKVLTASAITAAYGVIDTITRIDTIK